MPACELRPATQYDTDAVYALIVHRKPPARLGVPESFQL